MKKIVSVVLIVLISSFMVFAADENWWYGKEIEEFAYSGLKNVNESDVDAALYKYRHAVFSDEVFADIKEALYNLDGVDFFMADAQQNDNGGLRLYFEFYEIPLLTSISFEGNEKVKTSDIRSAVTSLSAGTFVDFTKKSVFEVAKQQIIDLYATKGFETVPVEYSITEDEDTNTFAVVFSITEGIQTRIVSINFSGNDNVDSSVLKKQVTSKVKSLFNNGYLNESKLKTDVDAIALYYRTNGYIDVIVGDPVIEELESSNEKFKEVSVTFPIVEGSQWFYGGMEVSGNTIFTNEEINAVLSMKVGSVLNLQLVQNEYSAVADLYYNDGYISNGMDISEERDDTNMTVKYFLTITEGPQAHIEDILISGLTKTKEYVMRRELAFSAGDVFSKAKLVTSAQNLYNTGLLSDLSYDLLYGKEENDVIVDFKLEEGSQKDIQFGATFGGTVDGFPVSGFLTWSDRNLGGRGQQLDISTTISPDTQSLSFSFGDSWFGDKRWSNSISLGFTHKKVEGELQRAAGVPYYDGRNSSETYPLGFSSSDEWNNSSSSYPSSKYLMDYNLFTFSFGYNTGYTFIYDVGRLSFSGGLSVSLNKAVYDKDIYDPFEKLVYKYGQTWQFSNKLTLAAQWDGRDYVTNTTKGYVLGTSITYAGGLLGGLSNYIKLTGSAAGYLNLFSFETKEEKTKNIMLCVSTSASVMLPQFYNYEKGGFKFYDPKLGATKYEMLYIDGMTIARGHDTITDQSFLWDNMLEISYQLVDNVIQAEMFASATGIVGDLEDFSSGLNWYFAAGAGIKLKISGFPLGLYLVKDASYTVGSDGTRSFAWLDGSYFGGMKLVLAISTSLI